MPIYEYECSSCSSRFELRKSFNDTDHAACPRCGGKAGRIFVPVPIIFKGSGFYVTDHRKNGETSSDSETKSKSTPEIGSCV